MKRFPVSFLGALLIAMTLGGGCFSNTEEYIPAPEPAETDNIEPNVEGARASTGGFDATITPQIQTERLIAALPGADAVNGYAGETPLEKRNPVPLPDGTQGEFVSVERVFTDISDNGERRVNVALADTRGIPVLTAFLDSYSPFETASGYRKSFDVKGTASWITYTNDPAGGGSGFGSLTMLYRDRFLIQIDGNLGVSREDLLSLARAFTFDELK